MTEARADIENLVPPAHRRSAEPPAADYSLHGEHPVIRLPFNVVIHGRSFVGNGLSIVGADATGLIDPQLHGRVMVVTLVFSFPGYSISLPVDAAIGAGAPKSGTVSFRFLEPTGPHLPQLRYILNSYVGGDLIGVDGLLAAEERDSGPQIGRSPAREKSFAALHHATGCAGARWPASACASSASSARNSTSACSWRRSRASRPSRSKAWTCAPSAPASSTSSIRKRKRGDIAFAIRTTSGEVLAVSMPCDCVVAPGSAQGGATVLAGDTVMTVAPADAPVVVSTQVDSRGLKMLASGASAEVQMPDGTRTTAALDPADLPGLLRTVTDAAVIPVDLVPADAARRRGHRPAGRRPDQGRPALPG